MSSWSLMAESQPTRLSIQWTLPIAICTLMLLVLLVLGWVAYRAVAFAEHSASEQRLGTVSRQFVDALASDARGAVRVERVTAALPPLEAYLRAPGIRTAKPATGALAYSGPQPAQVLCVELRDARGAVLLSSGARCAAVSNILPPHLLANAADSGAVGPFLSVDTIVAVPTAAPIPAGPRSNAEPPLGFLIEWRQVSASAAEREQTTRLLGIDAALLLGSTGGVWFDRVAVVDAPAIDLSSGAAQYYRKRGGGLRMALPAPVAGTPWLLTVEFSDREVLAPARKFLQRVALIAVLLFAGTLVGVWLLVRRITRRLRQLTDAAEAVSRADYSGRVSVRGQDELARLGSAFNRMAERVEVTHRHLEDKVAELRNTQQQFLHAQRMEAVGRLAGGVAHDFNNLLTVIIGETDLALAETSGDEGVVRSLSQIRLAGERATLLTRQLLAFSRRQLIEPTVFDLNDLVLDLERMLGRLLGENVRLSARTTASVATVRADRGQIEQVVMNLVVNARDALPSGGQIVVETQNVTLDEAYAESHPEVTAGDYVMLAVSDTGVGMDEETRAHLFEPFFTTKERGKGTGLGLATSFGIVKQSSGHIAVYTECGVGTTMKVYLPAVHQVPETRATNGPALVGGHETVLLVEDDEGVRRVAVRILGSKGYHVIEAGDGESAVATLADRSIPIDLVFTDVILPGMGGRELAERAEAERPGIKVLFASGYTDDLILQHQLIARGVSLLQKPFSVRSLLQKVREVLDAT
ncbi:MAG: ATP-binding protein [Gemmatimonadota bacterium]